MQRSNDRLFAFVVAMMVRLVALSFSGNFPAEGDESSYLGVAHALLETGTQDVFWPPLTGWLIACVGAVLGERLFVLRAAMCVLDALNVVFIHDVALRATEDAFDEDRRARIAFIAAVGYALYVPALGFATSMTSEVPTVTLVLLSLRALLAPTPKAAAIGWSAFALGLATLARSNLLLLPIAFASVLPTKRAGIRIAFVVIALLAPIGWTVRNGITNHGFTLSTNASYNLYVGNAPDAQQELDVFWPVATRSQRALRAGGEYVDAEIADSLSHEERMHRAIGFVRDAPLRFLRRSVGRLARVFAPRTAQLTLIGGSRAGSLSRPLPATLLLVGLVQWVPLLFGGILGLATLVELRSRGGRLLVATVLGSLPLCLIALAKPRYSFPFEPVLFVGFATALVGRVVPNDLGTSTRRVVLACSAFLSWGILAWFVFAFTSRA